MAKKGLLKAIREINIHLRHEAYQSLCIISIKRTSTPLKHDAIGVGLADGLIDSVGVGVLVREEPKDGLALWLLVWLLVDACDRVKDGVCVCEADAVTLAV